MPCLKPRQIINPRYKEGGWKKRMIICRDYYGFENSLLQREPNGSLSWYPPDYYIQIPCGLCAECRKTKRNGWSIRLFKELRCHSQSSFLTLTLDNSNLQRFKDDPKKPLKLYIDRLRKALGYRPRYFFVSELGDENDRLHYHGILFGTSEKDLKFALMRDKWNYGHSWIGYCNDKTAKYIVKYMLKFTKDYKPFVLCSNGIGKSYVTDITQYEHINGFDPKLYVTHNGFKYPLPPYYRDKFFTPEIKALFLVNRLNDLSPFERSFHGHTFNDECSYQSFLSSFYQWTLNNDLSVPEIIKQNILLTSNFIENGEFCIPESRAGGYSAEQTRFVFV